MLDFVKFFQSDIISGEANKVGDKFVAFFLISDIEFEVVELGNECFFAKAI